MMPPSRLPARSRAPTEVNKLAKMGVDIIKAHSGLTREDYAAIVKAAHANGIKVHAHLYDEPAVRNAFETGVDVLQHVGSAGGPTYSPELVKAIAAGEPSGGSHRGPSSLPLPPDHRFPREPQDPELKSLFPPGMWEGVQDSLKDWRNLGLFQRHRPGNGISRSAHQTMDRFGRGGGHGD